MDFLLYYAKVLEVDYLEDEIKQAYEDVLVNNKKEYRSPEVVATMYEGRFTIYFQDMEVLLDSNFLENKVFDRIMESTAFQEKYYPDPMVLYENTKIHPLSKNHESKRALNRGALFSMSIISLFRILRVFLFCFLYSGPWFSSRLIMFFSLA